MIFSRIGSSLSRSSRFRNVINGANRGRSLLCNNENFGASDLNVLNGNFKQIDGNLMFMRGYLSTQAPKKNDYEDFNQNRRMKFQNIICRFRSPKEGGNTDNNGSSCREFALLVIERLFSPFSSNHRAGQQISFQEFKYKLLKPGLVDRIVVPNKFITNKPVAKVYVRRSPQNESRYDTIEGGKSSQARYKYYLDIGSGNSFEKKLDKAQEAMGPRDYVPVTYVYEYNWHKAIMWSCLLAVLDFHFGSFSFYC